MPSPIHLLIIKGKVAIQKRNLFYTTYLKITDKVSIIKKKFQPPVSLDIMH